MILFMTAWVALAAAWFGYIMLKRRASLASGLSFLFLMASVALWVTVLMFIYSQQIMEHRVFFMVLMVLFALAVFALLLAPAALVITFFVEGIRNIRREGLRPANCLSLAFGILLLGYLFFWPMAAAYIRSSWMTALYLVISIAAAYLVSVFAVFACSAALCLVHLPGRRNLDQVIVLGAGILGDRLTPLLKARIGRGIEIMERNPGSILILSGGQGPGEDLPEGEAMTAYVLEQGIDPARVRTESESLNTEQNLLYSRKLFKGPRTAVVSSGYHVFRALILARNLGIPAIGYGAGTKWYFTLNAFIREYVGYLKLTWKRHALTIAILCLPVLAVWLAGSLG